MNWFKNYFYFLVYFLFFSFIAILQLTFISSLPPAYFAINLPLSALLFSLLIFNRSSTLVLAVLMGFWLDIFSFNFFGLHILILVSVVFLLDFLLNNWLTNRSLYSFLMLSIIGAIAYDFLLYTILAIWQDGQSNFGFFFVNFYFWKQLFWQMFWNASFTLLLFSVANSLSKQLKPFFLEKK